MDAESTGAATAYRYAVRGLMGLGASDGTLDDPSENYVEKEHEDALVEGGLLLALQHCFVARVASHNHFRQYAQALEAYAESAARGSIYEILFAQWTPPALAFHHCIASAACILDGTHPDPEAGRAALDATREQFGPFAETNPTIFAHMKLLLDAEAAALDGNELDAIGLYDDAIDRARADSFLNDEALSLERAAMFHERGGRSRIARQYRRDARNRYETWGAAAKVAQIERELGETTAWQTSTHSTILKPVRAGATSLDMASVLKAALIVSGEGEMDRLLRRSMEILVENAGVGRGVLLLSDGAGLLPSAVSQLGGADARTLVGAELTDVSYPQAVGDYCRRTRDPVVLAEATQDALFGTDGWITEHKPRSVMSVPILNKGRLIGILYGENNLSAGAFTTDRVGVLQALCSQIAVSIENARLFHQQKKMTDAFAQFVPQELLEHLGRNSVVDIERGDAVGRDITVLFSDLRDFTSMSEGMTARENFKFLNNYMERMEPAIEAHKGFVDKYMGDAIMALFSRTSDDAIASAVEMHSSLQRYTSSARARARPPSPWASACTTAPPSSAPSARPAGRVDTTVIGDTVNLASRLEGLTKRYGSNLLVSDDALRQTEAPEAFLTRHAGRVRVKGKKLAATVHEVLNADPEPLRDAKMETLDLYRAGTEAYYGKAFPDAAEQFRKALEGCPKDTMVAYWMGRSVEASERPLPEGWTGIEELTSK